MIELKSFPPEFYSQGNHLTDSANELTWLPRPDRRKPDQQRKLFMKISAVGDADGSAYVELGETKVLCSIHGPREIDKISAEYIPSDFDVKGTFSANVSFAPFATKIRLKRNPRRPETDLEQSLGRSLVQAFSSAIHFEKYPKSQINASVKVLEDDGSVLSAIILCCTLALSDAGIELYDVVLASSCIAQDEFTLCDPSSIEEERNAYGVTVALMPSLNQVSLVHQVGDSDAGSLPRIMKTLTNYCCRIYPALKTTLTEQFNRNEDCVQ